MDEQMQYTTEPQNDQLTVVRIVWPEQDYAYVDVHVSKDDTAKFRHYAGIENTSNRPFQHYRNTARTHGVLLNVVEIGDSTVEWYAVPLAQCQPPAYSPELPN